MLKDLRYEDLPFYEIGYEEGYKKGYDIGYKIGFKKAFEGDFGEGVEDIKIAIAKEMKLSGFNTEIISTITELSIETVETL